MNNILPEQDVAQLEKEKNQSDLYSLFTLRAYEACKVTPGINVEKFFEGVDLNNININPQGNMSALPYENNSFLRNASSIFSASDFAEDPDNLRVKTSDEGYDIFETIKEISFDSKNLTDDEISEVAKILHKTINEIPNDRLRRLLLNIYPNVESILEQIHLPQERTLATLLPRQLLSQALQINYAFENNTYPTSYVVVESLVEQTPKPSESIEQKRRLKRNTVEYLVEEKSKELPPPSDNLRFSLQIPAYNELPIRATDFKRRGSISDQLLSVVNAAETYTKDGGNASEIEVLINVNNSAEQSFTIGDEKFNGTLNNYYTLKLVELINNPEITAEEAVDILIDELMFIDPESPDFEILKSYYTLLIERAKKAVQSGLRIHTIDCTDGNYISRQDANSPILYKPNQAARRLLLSEITVNRFAKAKTDREQVHIFLDADIRLSRQYFNELNRHFNSNRESSPRALLLPLRVVPPEAYDVDYDEEQLPREQAEHLTQLYRAYFYYRDFIGVTSQIGQKLIQANKTPSLLRSVKRALTRPKKSTGDLNFTPFLETLVVNNTAHTQGGNWGLYGSSQSGGNEDTAYSNSLEQHNVPLDYLNTSITSRVNRIRDESWGGRKGTWIGKDDITFRDPAKYAVAFFLGYIKSHYKVDYPGDFPKLSPKDFTYFIIELANTIKLTTEEKEILLKHGLSKTNNYVGLNDINFPRANYGEEGEFITRLNKLISLCRELALLQDISHYPNLANIFSQLGSLVQEEIQKSITNGTYTSGDTDPLRITTSN